MGAKKKNKQERYEKLRARSKMYKGLAKDPRAGYKTYKKHK